MKYLDALKKMLKEQAGVGVGERWIREWLILNNLNRNVCVPVNAPFTQVTALRLLFEYPYQAICQVLSDENLLSFAPYVAVSDTKPTDILVINIKSGKCVASFKHKAWEFRWKSMSSLEEWMRTTADVIMGGQSAIELDEQEEGSDGTDHGKHPRRKGPARKAAGKHR